MSTVKEHYEGALKRHALIEAYFDKNSFVEADIQSFNHFVDVQMPLIVKELGDVVPTVIPPDVNDFRIKLDTQAPKSSEDGTKEGLFIIVKNDVGEELPIENLSGGEFLKTHMAISEAIAGLSNQIGFRIMDEVIVGLDNESLRSFVVVLEKIQQMFSQILCISHIQEIKDTFESKIMCLKINGITKIYE